jgi:hypothetical protein
MIGSLDVSLFLQGLLLQLNAYFSKHQGGRSNGYLGSSYMDEGSDKGYIDNSYMDPMEQLNEGAERRIEIMARALVSLILYNQKLFRKFRGEPPAESDDELIRSFVLSLVAETTGRLVSVGVFIWLLVWLFDTVVRFVLERGADGVGGSTFAQLLDAAQNAGLPLSR